MPELPSDVRALAADLYGAVFARALDAMLIVDAADGRVLDANDAAAALLGVARAALCGAAEAALIPPAGGDGAIALAGPPARTLERHVVAEVAPGHSLVVLRDIGERRRADEARAWLIETAEAAGDALAGFGADGRITYWSPACERLFGWTAAEAIGRPAQILIPPEAAGDYDDVIAAMRRGEPRTQRDSVRLHKDGRRVPVAASYAPIRRDGRLAGVAVVLRDMTEKVRSDDQLAVTDRLATAGTLAAGVAHEINNPLAALIANLEHVAQALGAHLEAVREPLADARAGASRIKEIVRDLRFLANPGDATRASIDVRDVLRSTVRVAGQEIRARARLVEAYGEVPRVDANAARLGQVLVNLIVNATQAIPEGDAAHHEIFVGTRAAPDGRVVITVRDTGAGIAPELLKRIFDPFYTSRPVGSGTGLGLTICHRLVAELGGEIKVDSAPGEGSTFEVVLPAGARPAAPPPPAPVAAAASRRRILVIDDEPIVGRAVRRVLQTEHDVTIVTSAAAALDALAAGEAFDVILCDLMMPQMTGMELHEHLARTAPAIAERMIFLTGGAFTPAARAFLERVPNRCFEKPFDAAQLRAVIAGREVMA